jgi:DNA-binding transcriptional ArsR family regulator
VKLNLDATFSALADPTRRAILARLALGETPVMELAKPFAMSLPAVSKHLKVLERAGLITRGREAQWRPCRIEPRALKEVDDWLEHYRRFYDESFDRLDDYLKRLQAKEPRTKELRTKEPRRKEPKARSTKHDRKK